MIFCFLLNVQIIFTVKFCRTLGTYPHIFIHKNSYQDRKQEKPQMPVKKKEKVSKKDFSRIHILIKQVTDLAGIVFVTSLQHSLGKSIPWGSC